MPPAVNRYQEQKIGNELIALARTIFKSPAYAKGLTVIGVSRIQDSNGKDQSIKVEMHVPGNPKAFHTMHISTINYRTDNKPMWPHWLAAQAKEAVKRMRMMKSRAAEVRELADVDGGE